jgi:hypothetical protein
MYEYINEDYTDWYGDIDIINNDTKECSTGDFRRTGVHTVSFIMSL